MHPQGFRDLLHVGDGCPGGLARPGAADGARVGNLTTRLGIERGAVQDEFDAVHAGGLFGPVRDHRHPFAVDENAQNSCLRGQFVETGEFGRPGVDQLTVGSQVGVRMLACGSVSFRAAALLGHQLPEPELVDPQVRFGGHLEGEFDREPVGVVQREGIRAGQHTRTGYLGGARYFLEEPRTRLQRPVERGLLGDRNAVDPVEIGDQLGVGRAHCVADGGHQFADDRAVDVEQLGRADHPSQQPAQHISASVVAGTDSVADQDGRCAAVVGDDAVADVVLVVAGVVAARRAPGDHVDDRTHQVCLVDVGHTLKQECDPLDSHAGVDVLAWQRTQDLEVVLAGALAAFVLHEHEIPDLDVAVLVGFRAAVDAELRSAVEVDLRGRATRPWDAHRPVVVGHAAPLNSLSGQVRDLAPQLDGLVIVEIDCGPELLRVEAIAAVFDGVGQQGPGQLDGFAFEVVAE